MANDCPFADMGLHITIDAKCCAICLKADTFVDNNRLSPDALTSLYVSIIESLQIEFNNSHHADLLGAIALILREAEAHQIGTDPDNPANKPDDDLPEFLRRLFN